MTPYAQQVQQDRRLVILRLLCETPGHSSNSSIITDALEPFGHSISRCLLYTSPSPRDRQKSRMPSSA